MSDPAWAIGEKIGSYDWVLGDQRPEPTPEPEPKPEEPPNE